jgi:hypothetical protein
MAASISVTTPGPGVLELVEARVAVLDHDRCVRDRGHVGERVGELPVDQPPDEVVEALALDDRDDLAVVGDPVIADRGRPGQASAGDRCIRGYRGICTSTCTKGTSMARAAGSQKTMTTSEARTALPQLARAAARRSKPSKGLRENAVEIQPRGEERSAYLVPEIDVENAERRIQELEEELEDISLVRLVEQRFLADRENLAPVDDVIRELGFDDLLVGETGG